MSTSQLTSEILQQVSLITDDEGKLQRVLRYLKRITAPKPDPTTMTYDEFCSMVHESETLGWKLVNSRNFSQEEIDAVASAEVVPSQYGKSVKFALKSGGCVYIPLSRDSILGTGQTVNLQTAKILTLSKPGEMNIDRIEA